VVISYLVYTVVTERNTIKYSDGYIQKCVFASKFVTLRHEHMSVDINPSHFQAVFRAH
jgi:hypothetical protein